MRWFSHEPPDDFSDPLVRKRAMRLLFFVVVIDLMSFGIIIPLLPSLALRFEASPMQIALLFSAYSVCQFLSAPLLGGLSDRVGRRPVLFFSQIGSGVAFVVLAAAVLIPWGNLGVGLAVVFVARVLDGISGGNISAAQAYVTDITGPEGRAKAMGMIGAAFGIGFVVGPGIGGIAGAIHPALPWVAGAMLSFSAAALTLLRLPETRVMSGPVPRALEEERAPLLLLVHARRVWTLASQPVVGSMLGITFVLMFAFAMLEATFALFLIQRFGFSPAQIGGFFVAAGVVIIIIQGFLIGRLARRLGEWTLMFIGAVMVTVAMSLFVQSAWTGLIAIVLIGGLFNACGRSLIIPALHAILSRHTPPDRQGATFGLNNGLSSLARVFGPVVAGAAYTLDMTGPFAVAGLLTFLAAGWVVYARARARDVPQYTTDELTDPTDPTDPDELDPRPRPTVV